MKLKLYYDLMSQPSRALFKKVPVIDHNGFILTESYIVIRYLACENVIPIMLYPKNSKAQARVDEYLEWQHIGLRLHCAMFFRVKYLNPIYTGKQPDPKLVQSYEKRMINALKDSLNRATKNGWF
ncbi:unnamed protein product [Pieris macdunnoughi]|uniref:GST N-terminal domain-containing protein n=1 Tax=Pieris macdunnoughi TaxID=345717 RepID=A0A821W2P0_9NEOP|nr:unnamed protein product [Pieris macdunnoughi]